MYENLTVEEIKANIKALIPDDISTDEGSYTDNIISAISYEMWKYYQTLDSFIPIAFVDETSGDYILKRAAEYGIYQKSGTYAQVTLKFTGESGREVQEGTIVSTLSGLEYTLLQSGTVGVDETASITAQALEIGSKYNAPSASITQIGQAIDGITSVTNESAASGGTDKESVESVFYRLRDFRQRPATSGNAYHYEKWATEVNGIGSAKIKPLWNGNGTVKVIVTDHNKQPVSQDIVERCSQYIETQRPIGATVTVVSATAFSVVITAEIVLDGSVSLDAILSTFKTEVDSYLKSISFNQYTLLYSKVLLLLLSTNGVMDYTSMTINGGTSNITIDADSVPVLGEVSIHA